MSERAASAVPKNPPAADPFVGRVINERFKITGLIAKGGMGRVYRAEQAPLGRVCAIKVLNPNYSGAQDPEFHKRFFLEASIASKLTHPNTVTIFDYGNTEDDIYYMAMEYLEGRTLHRAIRQAGCFPEERAAHVARQICRALREAHGMGVIHRDLKPANIYLVEHGDEPDFVKVLDFGLVKQVSENRADELTQAGLFMGSPKYMAPEQVRGQRVDARTDIYALGVILYEMVSGKVPFDRPNSVHILMAHVNEPPPPLRVTNPQIELSATMEQIITRCMAKDPDQRFHSMEEVLAELKRVGATGTSRAPAGHTGARAAMPPPPSSGSLPAETGSHSMPASVTGPTGSTGPTGLTMPSASPLAGSAPASSGALLRKRKRALAAAAVSALAVAGVVGYAAVRAVQPAPAAAPSAAASASVAQTSAPVAAAARPEDTIVKVRISSDPDGATVKENGVPICTGTPCDVLYADADPNRVHTLSVSLPGYRTETKAIRVGDSPIIVRMTPDAP